MEFVESGEAALRFLESRKVDVIVSDMHMPGMDGAQLLQRVRERWPAVGRIILSGYSDRSAVIRTVGVAHQFLAKPCDENELKAVVARTCGLRSTLVDPELMAVLTEVGELPAIPSLYAELNRELSRQEPSLVAMGKLIAKDPGMSARMLHLVNSAFFGLRRRVRSVEEAVTRLGTDVLCALVLSSTTFTTFTNEKSAAAAEELWRHSARVAEVAAFIASSNSKDRLLADCSFQSGMLHEIGRLILTFKLGARADEFGSRYGQIGAYLLGIWGMDDLIVEAVAYHRAPHLAPPAGLSPLIAVHIANHLIHASRGESDAFPLDPQIVERADIQPHLPSWINAGIVALEQDTAQ